MRYLTLSEALELHERVVTQTGGASGLRDMGGLESALAQPRMTFEREELYPTTAEKAAALGFSIIQNHPFVDGNKRTGHAAMEIFLVLNGYEIDKSVDEQEAVILQVASGSLTRRAFTNWVRASIPKR
ncbi:MAG: type II toxin-antitoxin system death-on-curing family toxin [Chloroflexi bacterium]|nr:type II toxin-antitoxin system death-on-curing family toxin [Chloroflexota bacterium]